VQSLEQRSPRILVTRRDNVGDLLCTTPLLYGIRRRYPQAYLAVLVSSYNADVIEGNPDVDEVLVFPKRQEQGRSLWSTLSLRRQLVRSLRQRRFDDIILANGGWRYARHLGGRRMIGFRERDNPPDRQPDLIVPLENGRSLHEVEKMARLGLAIDVSDTLGPLRSFPAPDAVAAVGKRLEAKGFRSDRASLAIHISSRRPQQRWPEDSFVALIKRLHQHSPELQFLLFWSPGGEDHPLHPGDDEKARGIQSACPGAPLFPCPTARVRDLIAALGRADRVVCSDGGALHVAASLGKPIVCLFGDSIAAEWRPWGVPYVLLQPPSRVVADITVDDVVASIDRLAREP
jgi:heptosyltransferase-3